MKKIFILLILLLAGIILSISIARANLETVMREEKEDRIRVVPYEYVTNMANGEEIKSVYYLPKIKILPTNILYPFKIWRDKLWIALTRNPCERSRLLLLIADKQMAEEDAISASEAVDKLIWATSICPTNSTRTNEAIKAYRQMTSKMRKYSQANEKIEKFIKEEGKKSNFN